MKSTHVLIGLALSLTRSRWLQPTLFSLAFAALVLGVTGCSSPHH